MLIQKVILILIVILYRMMNLNTRLAARHPLSFVLFLFVSTTSSHAQNIYADKDFQFLSFEKIPTWVGVATSWNEESPDIHLYDAATYKGHAGYVSIGLKTGITFQQFKDQVRNYQSRKYLPFFLFDLREMNVVIDGSSYEWAVRIEDYRYRDNQQQMEATCSRLLNNIAQYIGKQSGSSSKGIIVLPTNSKSTPNTAIAPAMNKNGYPNLTLSQLLAKAGGKKVEVLNVGTGIGYLRYIRDDGTTFHPSPKDILIYENLPDRVFPVSGIITLKPQTPLSHINLLAKNRGTINLYATDLKYLPGADKLLNKLVKIECSGSKISISEITEKEAKKFWAARVIKVEIPQPISSVSNIVDLNHKNKQQTTRHIGAKAANYARIRQSFSKYVPQGFAIPFAHYFSTLKSCGADTLILALVSQKTTNEERNIQLKKIRAAIRGARVDPFLIKQLNGLITNRFNNSKIRLRSSTNCEDLPEFNGAGLYLSKGFKKAKGDKVLEKKILQVYASLWEPIAFEEREYYFIDHTKAGMAILINRAFSDEYANGVALTMVEKGKVSIHINTQYGENAVTNPKNGQIPESIIYKSASSDGYEIRTRSNIHDIFLQDSLKNQLPELKEAVLNIHQMMTKRVEGKENQVFGIDIEFKLMNELDGHKLYIKQARLIRTILPK